MVRCRCVGGRRPFAKLISALGALAIVGASTAAAVDVSPDTGQVLIAPAEYTLVHRLPPPGFQPTVAYDWVEVVLKASGLDAVRHNPRPTVLSRTMAIVLTAMYDAWAAYDDKALCATPGCPPRRPKAERSQANKEKAIAFAAYRALLFVYPAESEWIAAQFKQRGHDPGRLG